MRLVFRSRELVRVYRHSGIKSILWDQSNRVDIVKITENIS